MAIFLDAAFSQSIRRRDRQKLIEQQAKIEEYEVLSLSDDISHVCRSLGINYIFSNNYYSFPHR